MIMLAQLPSTEISYDFSWTIEAIKTSLKMVDIWAIKQMFIFLNSQLKSYPSRLRVLVVGLGCAVAHSILHYLLPMIPAKNIEFSWDYFLMAVDSNITLVLLISLVALTWLTTRRDLSASLIPFTYLFHLMLVCVDSGCTFLRHKEYGTEFQLLTVKGSFVVLISVLTYFVFSRYDTTLTRKVR